jgi:hypothetical protein
MSLRMLYRRWILETAAAASKATADGATAGEDTTAASVPPPATLLIVDVDFTAPVSPESTGAVLTLATPGAHAETDAAPSAQARADPEENDRECAATAARLAVAAAEGALLSPLWDAALVDPPRSRADGTRAPEVRARGCVVVASSVDPFRPAVWAYEALASEGDATSTSRPRDSVARHQSRHGYEALARVLTTCVNAGPEAADPNGAAWGVTDLYRSIVAALDAQAVLVAQPPSGNTASFDGDAAADAASVLGRVEGFVRVQPSAVGLHTGVFAQAMREAVRIARGISLQDELAAPCDPLAAFNQHGHPAAPPGAGGLSCLRAVHPGVAADSAMDAGRATASVVCRRKATLGMGGWDLVGATFTVAESDPETASFSLLRGDVGAAARTAPSAVPATTGEDEAHKEWDANTKLSPNTQSPERRVHPAGASAGAAGDAASNYAAASRLRALKKRSEDSAAQEAHLDLCRRTHAQLAVAHRAFALLFDIRSCSGVETSDSPPPTDLITVATPTTAAPSQAETVVAADNGTHSLTEALSHAREAGARYAALWWRVACAHSASRGPFGEERLARVLQAAVRAAARASCAVDGAEAATSNAAASYAASVVSASAATQRLLRQQTQLLSDPRLRDLARANIESIVQEAAAEAEAELAALSPAQLEERRELREHIRLRQEHRIAVRRAIALADGAEALRACSVSVAVPTAHAAAHSPAPLPAPGRTGATVRLHWRVFTRRVLTDCDSGISGVVRAALGARLQCHVDPDAHVAESFLSTVDWVRLRMRLPLLERWASNADGTREAAAEQLAAALAAISAAAELGLQHSAGGAPPGPTGALASEVVQEVLQSALRVAAVPDLAARITDAVNDSAAALLRRYQTHRALRGLAPLHAAGADASDSAIPLQCEQTPSCRVGLSAVYLSEPHIGSANTKHRTPADLDSLDSRFFTVDCHADVTVEDATEATLLMSAVAGLRVPVCDAVSQLERHLASSPPGAAGVDALLCTGVASAFYAGRAGWPIVEIATSDPDGSQIYPSLLHVSPDRLATPAVAWTFGHPKKSEHDDEAAPNMAAFAAVLLDSSVRLDAVVSVQVDAPAFAASAGAVSASATRMSVHDADASQLLPHDHGVDTTIQQSTFRPAREAGDLTTGGGSGVPASSLLAPLMVAERWTDLAMRRVQRRMFLEAKGEASASCFADLVPLPGVLGSLGAPAAPARADAAATTTRGSSHKAAGSAASGSLWFGVAPVESATLAHLDWVAGATGGARAALRDGFAASLAAVVAAAPSRKVQLLAAEHTRLVAAATRRWHDAAHGASDFSALLPRALALGPKSTVETDKEAIATALEEEAAADDVQGRAAAARTLLRLGKLLPSLRYFAPGPARERALRALLDCEIVDAPVLAHSHTNATLGSRADVHASWRVATPSSFRGTLTAGGGVAVARAPTSLGALPVTAPLALTYAPPVVFDSARLTPVWAPGTRVVVVAVVPALGAQPALRASVLGGLSQVAAAFGSRGAAACWVDACPSALQASTLVSPAAAADGGKAPTMTAEAAAVWAAVRRHVALAVAAEERALGPALAPLAVAIDGRLSHAGAALLVVVRLSGAPTDKTDSGAVVSDACSNASDDTIATSWAFPCVDAASVYTPFVKEGAHNRSMATPAPSSRSVFAHVAALLARFCL